MKLLAIHAAMRLGSFASIFIIGILMGGGLLHAAQRAEVEFNISGQSLASALTEVGGQAKVQVLFNETLVQGLKAPALKGRSTAQAALNQLLRDTGLTAVASGPGTFTIQRAKQSSAQEPQPEPAITLPQVTVQDTRDRGFVASQSSVGTKTDAPLIETPQSISVITREEMDTRNVQTDAEALLYTAGVWAQPFGGRQNLQNPFFYVRGFESAFGGSYVDGLVSPVNYRYEPYGVERVEVLRGPTSTLYGQSDPGGLVNRESKRPTAEPLREIQLQGGNYDRFQGAFDVGGPIDSEGKFLYRLTTVYRNSDAPVKYDFSQTIPDDRVYAAPAFTWRPSANISLTLLGSYLKDNGVQENSYLAPDYRLTHVRLSQRNFDDFNYHQYAMGYLFEQRFGPAWTFTQKLRFGHLKYDYLSLGQDTLLGDGHTVSRFTDGFFQTRNDLALDNQVQVKFATGPVAHQALFGLDYQKFQETVGFAFGLAPDLDTLNPDYHQQIDSSETYLKQGSRNSIVGVYFQDQLKFYDRWLLTLGGRYDWNRGRVEDKLFGGSTRTSDGAFTYRAGVTYLSDFGVAPYFSYATSFLPTGGADFSGSPFEPTTGQQYEVGMKYQPKNFNGFFTVALFHLTKQNVTTPDPELGHENFSVQTGEIRSRGVELEAAVSLAEGLNLKAAYTYNDVEITKANPDLAGIDTKGKRPKTTPDSMASAWIDYTIQGGPLLGLGFGGGVRYVSSTFADDANTVKNSSYTLFDAALRFDLGRLTSALKGARLSVNGSNLFNKEYTTCFTLFDCKWGARRTVMGTVAYRW